MSAYSSMKKFISIVVSVAILVIIYAKIDVQKLVAVFQNCDLFWMIVSLAMVIPITMFTSWRLQQLMPQGTKLGFLEANRLILGASVLNMVLPSKMGDIAKAYFMKDRGHLSASLSLSLVIFEKTCDMLSLLLWCVFGLILYPAKDTLFWTMTLSVTTGLILGLLLLGSSQFANSFLTIAQKTSPPKIGQKIATFATSWSEMHDYFWRDKKQLLVITSTSVFIWFLHLLQIWFFIFAIQEKIPFLFNLALSPLSILAGLLPLTFAGVGTRDAALIFFYKPFFSAAKGAALGLLCTSRYLLPAMLGLPFLEQMMAAARKVKR